MGARSEPELVLETRAQLGEGALWNAARQRLQWIDIVGQRVFTYDPATGGNVACEIGRMVGTVVARARGGLMLAVHEGFATLDPDSGRLALLPRPPEQPRATAQAAAESAGTPPAPAF